MKKLLINFCLLVLSLTLFSCFSNTCDLSGCEREATGWDYYETHQTGPFGGCIGACRMKSSGGYCTKDHVIQDL